MSSGVIKVVKSRKWLRPIELFLQVLGAQFHDELRPVVRRAQCGPIRLVIQCSMTGAGAFDLQKDPLASIMMVMNQPANTPEQEQRRTFAADVA